MTPIQDFDILSEIFNINQNLDSQSREDQAQP